MGYGTPTTSGSTTTYPYYKPQGLMQQYANKIRFAALSYLNGLGSNDQGGVLREPMGFIGPTYPTPLSSVLTTNPRAEWDGSTGIMNTNPDTASATASGVTQSGVMNYLNKFGEAFFLKFLPGEPPAREIAFPTVDTSEPALVLPGTRPEEHPFIRERPQHRRQLLRLRRSVSLVE